LPKILVIRFSSIGDIVLTTPVVRCIKQQLKDAEVHYLTKRAFAGILSSNPYIDKVYSIEKDIGEVIDQLRSENYDHIIDLHHNLRTSVVKAKLGRPFTSFNKLNLEKWMLVNLKWDRMPAVHVVDRYMEAVKQLVVYNDDKGLDYFIPPHDEVDISQLFKGGAKEIRTPLYIAFVIGAKHNTKQLPVEKIISVCRKINKPVVLLGGKEDAERGELIRAGAGEHVINACGKYNLNQSASLVRQADKVITHDTGLMHIAAAFKKTIISIWGNTVPAFGMYPYLPGEGSEIFEVKGLSCRPCSKIGYAKCPRGHFKCMNLIDEDAVAKAAN
jgi:ADP-heptose:LPS heptosyltransferase